METELPYVRQEMSMGPCISPIQSNTKLLFSRIALSSLSSLPIIQGSGLTWLLLPLCLALSNFILHIELHVESIANIIASLEIHIKCGNYS